MLAFADFPPHVQLMLLAARARVGPAESERILELTRDPALPWPGFLAVTSHHKLGSLVFRTLDRLRPPALPTFVRDQLHRESTANAFAALSSTAEISALAAAFDAAGLPLAVLKGVPLSQLLYGSPNARHVGDIDLLTTPNHLDRQIALLASAGYTLTNPAARLTPARIRSFAHFWKDFTFTNPTTGFDLDLHWRLFNNRHHRANPLLPPHAHAQPFTNAEVFGTPMRVLSFIDQFLYVTAHGISDAWIYLKSLADVAAFLQLLTPAELDRALLRAASLGLLHQISAAVHLANDWMGAGAFGPDLAQSPHLLPSDTAFARHIRARTENFLLRTDFRPDRTRPSPLQWLLLELNLVPGLPSIAEVFRRYVWRPRVWSSIDLPDRLFFLYPLLGLFLLPRQTSLKD